MNIRRLINHGLLIFLTFGLTACNVGGISVSLPGQDASVTASGTIDSDTVRVAPEIAGKVKTVSASKGDSVSVGDALFQLDDALLQSKFDETKAQVQLASAALDLAKQSLAGVQNQYQVALDSSRSKSGPVEAASWKESSLDAIDLPNWYFQKSETITALQSEIEASQTALDEEQKSLQTTLQNASNKDFVDAEARVNRAQTAFEIADQTLTQANDSAASDKQPLTDAAQKIYDQAKTELDAAQKAYNAMLTGTSATDVKEARARVAAAQTRLENAQDGLNALLTRDDSRPVETAKIAIDTAQKTVDQAQANLAVAQAAQHEVEVQLQKTVVSAPAAGVILSSPVKAGETVAAGTTVYEIGPLDDLKLTVYVTEDQFGRVKIGDAADVTVDSFPGETFEGKVTSIANEAEFTPRNVQTAESRSTTVFAVEIRLANPDLKLKPGMPADALIHVAK
jgi:multidrug resistance efflux pump